MSLEFAIIGGFIEIDRAIFAQEMLSKDSRLRKILNVGNLTKKLQIQKNKEQDSCLIDFTGSPDIEVSSSYQELLQSLEKDYPGKIKAKLSIRVSTEYSTFFTVYKISDED